LLLGELLAEDLDHHQLLEAAQRASGRGQVDVGHPAAADLSNEAVASGEIGAERFAELCGHRWNSPAGGAPRIVCPRARTTRRVRLDAGRPSARPSSGVWATPAGTHARGGNICRVSSRASALLSRMSMPSQRRTRGPALALPSGAPERFRGPD